ncbi:hypothetical protein [Streptomyces olivaceiscleroticus]|uniref:Uncharacterized protein n=1 Tax=Streptomyces olivaceiscleroticus TaxID=68245 RepID=A0ABP3JT37_9ACTN
MTTAATVRDTTHPEWQGIHTLGHANRFSWWDSEFRYDGRLRVPSGVRIKEVRYSFRGDGNPDVRAREVTRGRGGIDQEYEVIDRTSHDGYDVLTFTLRGDLDVDRDPRPQNASLRYRILVTVKLDNGETRIADPEIEVLAATWDRNDSALVGRPFVRLPYDRNWGGEPNSQAGFGYVSDSGYVPGDKFIVDLINPRAVLPGTPGSYSDRVYYQLVHEDGTPSRETPEPQLWKADGHTDRGDLSHKTMLPSLNFSRNGDKPGYYRFLVWPQAGNPDGSPSNLGWDRTNIEEAFQIGSVYYQYKANGEVSPTPVPPGQGQFLLSPGGPVTLHRNGEIQYPGVEVEATGDGRVAPQTVSVTLPQGKGLRFTGRLVVGVMQGAQWVQKEAPDGTVSSDGRVLTVQGVNLELGAKGSKSAVLVELQALANAVPGDTSLSFLIGNQPASSSSLIRISQ